MWAWSGDDGLPENTSSGIVWTVGAYGFQCFDVQPGQDETGSFVALEVQYVGPAGYEMQTRGLLAMALGQGDVSRVREAKKAIAAALGQKGGKLLHVC